MRLNTAGLYVIQFFEQLRLQPYLDQGDRWTVGWGHLLTADEQHEMLAPGFPGITREQARDLLMADLQKAINGVGNALKVNVNDNMFSALVSFAYNAGVNALPHGGKNGGPSRLLAKLNATDFAGAQGEFENWVWVTNRKTGKKERSEGLIRRRAVEAVLFGMPVNAGQGVG